MFMMPKLLNFDSNVNNPVYDAVSKNDMAGGLLAARDIMLDKNCMEPLFRNVKSEFTSDLSRKKGNEAYARNEYQVALMYYNTALLYAPKSSRAMKLAYSNRSALFFKAKYYSACINDIDTCISMGCPSELIEKLQKRKRDASIYVFNENMFRNPRESSLAEKLLKPKTSNPDIPIASLDIKVIAKPDGPMVVAARDIDVGTILAFESAFVSSTHPNNNLFSCYHCQKMSLNLIPCNVCCYALFCNMSCQEKCIEENHKYLCPIIDILNTKEPDTILATKALVKFRQTSNSWKDFIAMADGINGTGAGEISNLIMKKNKHFIVGAIFNHCFIGGVIMHYLDTKTDFFPQSPVARAEAIRAASTVLINLAIYTSSIMLHPPVYANTARADKMTAGNHIISNYGLFSFIGKLKRACLSNVNTVAVHRDVALVAVMPIKKDTEITTTHMSALWLEEDPKEYRRPIKMFFTEKMLCTCVICSGDIKKQTLTKIQAEKFHQINPAALQRDCNPEDFFYMFKKICEVMKVMSDAPFSEEYAIVYTIFKKCILYFQCLVARNFMITLC